VIDDRYAHHFTAEQVFGFVYAILHSQVYRDRYGEFLRRAFPRIPLPADIRDFELMAGLGWELGEKHLLRDVPSLGLARYVGRGSHQVDRIDYNQSDQSIWINETQCFSPVPETVWEFYVGGYQVIEKYLRSRKGRLLSLAEIRNVTNVANVLSFTIDQTRHIDAAYGSVQNLSHFRRVLKYFQERIALWALRAGCSMRNPWRTICVAGAGPSGFVPLSTGSRGPAP
jgi:hypothetical protein